MATELEKSIKGGKDLNAAIQALLPGIVKESKKVLFNGNGYADEWHQEAAKRGLPNLKSTVDVLPVVTRKDTKELFAKYKVYTEKELDSRFNILSEAYVKAVNIEVEHDADDGQDDDPSGRAAVSEGSRRIDRRRQGRGRWVAGGAGIVRDAGQLDHRFEPVDRRAGEGGRSSRRRRCVRPRQAHEGARAAGACSKCARRRTSWRRSSPTISGRCRRIGRCCLSSDVGFQTMSSKNPGRASGVLSCNAAFLFHRPHIHHFESILGIRGTFFPPREQYGL